MLQQLIDELIANPPDYEALYGAGTTGETIAQRTWNQCLSIIRARYDELTAEQEKTHPHLVNDGDV